jgi:hypothetical protein
MPYRTNPLMIPGRVYEFAIIAMSIVNNVILAPENRCTKNFNSTFESINIYHRSACRRRKNRNFLN